MQTDYQIKDSGQRTDFGTGSVRDMQAGKGRPDLLPMRALMALSLHFEKGGAKYGWRNWELGQPLSSYVSSMLRHFMKWMLGQQDENHLIAGLWNAICLVETVLMIQEGILDANLDDLPANPTGRKGKQVSAELKKLRYLLKNSNLPEPVPPHLIPPTEVGGPCFRDV